jgi:hypothetical protein
VPGRDPYDFDLNTRRHFGVFALTVTDRQGLSGLRPAEWNDGMRTLFIVVAVSSILVEIERAIGSLVNSKLNGFRGLLTRVLNLWAEGNN